MRDYNPTHPLGFGTEEPHPLPPPTNSDEIPVVGSSTEAIGMKWVITFQVAITQREYTFILRSQLVSGVVQRHECVCALQELETLMQLRVRNPSDGFIEG